MKYGRPYEWCGRNANGGRERAMDFSPASHTNDLLWPNLFFRSYIFFLLSRWRRLLRQMRRSVGFNLWFARNVTDFIATNLGLRSRPTEVHTHPTACNMIKCLMFNQCDDVVYVRHTVELDAKNMQEQSARKMCRERQSTTSIVHTQTVTLIIKNSIDRHTHRYIICR